MRRVARSVAAGRSDFDHQQRLRRFGLRKNIAHVSRIQAFAACGAFHRSGLDQSRGILALGRRACYADLGIAALARADRTRRKADLLLARDAYAAAYEVYRHMGNDYAAYFESKLKDIDEQLKR